MTNIQMTQLIEWIAMRPWIAAPALLFAAVLAGFAAHALVFRFAVRLARFAQRTLLELIVESARRPSRLFFPAMACAIALPLAPTPPAVEDALRRLVTIVLIGAVGWLAIAMLHAATGWLSTRYRMDVADNLEARRVLTQAAVLRRIAATLITLVAIALALMQIPGVQNIGMSLLASAGLAGIVVGLAARPTLSNLLAGLQLALTQPIRLDDVVIVEGEWGRIEEITNTYVVVRIWDERRLIVPLTHFIEKPFQNWTRASAELVGTVFLRVDHMAPIEVMRAELRRILESSPSWDGRVCVLQVTDAGERSLEIRALVSARDSGSAWDLRCEVREKLIAFLQQEHPDALPRLRTESTAALHREGAEQSCNASARGAGVAPQSP